MHCSERMRQQYIHVSTEGQKEEKDSAACNPVTQREIQRGGWALEVKTAALATVAVDGLLCRAGARVCLRVSLSLSLPPSRAFLLPTSHCRAAANPQPHSQSRRTATTYYLKTRENKGIPQDPQRGEEGQTTESSASYLSEISHSSHSGIIPFFLTLRRRERKPDRERVRESARSNNRRIGRKLHHCCAGVAAAPAVLLPPSPTLLPQHHPSPPLEKLMDYC